MVGRIIPWMLGSTVFVLSATSAEGYIGVRFPLANDPAGRWMHPLVIAFCLACGVAAGLARRWRWPVFALAAIGWVWLALWPVPLVASYYAGTLRRTRVVAYGLAALAGPGAASGAGTLIGGARRITTATLPNCAILAAVLVGPPLATGLWVNARRLAFDALRERARRLEHEQLARAEQARAQERTRIAQEMHDVVAHRVSLMVLHAGALEVSAADERTAEAAGLIRGIGRDALSDLRDVLGVLRSPHASDPATVPQPTLTDLDRLLDQTRSLGIQVIRRDEGEARQLPDLVERTAYRVVQEGLTNVHKHAGGASTEVVLRYLPEGVEVAVCNGPGDGPGDALPGAGLGLNGLRERVGLLGGEFEACPRPDGGFGMTAKLPAEGGIG